MGVPAERLVQERIAADWRTLVMLVRPGTA